MPVGSTTHAVVARTKGATNNNSEFGNLSTGHCSNHLGTVLGNALSLILRADHEAGNVLKEEKGDATLSTELNKVRALLS